MLNDGENCGLELEVVRRLAAQCSLRHTFAVLAQLRLCLSTWRVSRRGFDHRHLTTKCYGKFSHVLWRQSFLTCWSLMVAQAPFSLSTWRWSICGGTMQFFDFLVKELASIMTELIYIAMVDAINRNTSIDGKQMWPIWRFGTGVLFDLTVRSPSFDVV